MSQCDIVPVRSDQLSVPGKISEHTFARILADDLCIAILTGFNPNVFYELAIAHAARRPVIIMMEKGKELPFDVKDLRCVYYDFWPSSIVDKVYVSALVDQVNELKASNWTVSSISPQLEVLSHVESEAIRVHSRWRPELLYQALSRAAPESDIYLGTTSFHNSTVFFPQLESLFLESGKRFRLFVMLVDPDSDQIRYRFKLRSESADQMAAQVRDQIKHLFHLAERVNSKWITDSSAETLHLEIRLYDGFCINRRHGVRW
jgi:hypothetical protein